MALWPGGAVPGDDGKKGRQVLVTSKTSTSLKQGRRDSKDGRGGHRRVGRALEAETFADFAASQSHALYRQKSSKHLLK